MEIWNNVFSQFNNDGHGNYTELAQKNIDTGMGLERLACVMQGVDNMFLVDTNRAILDKVCAIADRTYGDNATADISIRVCTDHIKSAMFMIADGVIPSNEGRGYVLRRIIRRACRHGKLLGINRPFLAELCEVAMGQNQGAYPELREKHDYILQILSLEEKRFDATIDAGLSILSNLARDVLASGKTVISGDDAFRLYDTFGFPVDLTREIVAEQQLTIDEETFRKLMQAQRERARSARANISGWSNASKTLLAGMPKTEFVGYTATECDAKVVALLVDDMAVEEVTEGDFTLVLDRTPFYGESGGQVGDTGTVTGHDFAASVTDVQKSDGVYIHLCSLARGSVRVGDSIHAEVSDVRRTAIMRNHSACHLLQAALRTVLGKHVEQAGSYVDGERVRFDFTHFAPLTAEQLKAVEGLVNARILVGLPVEKLELPIEEAKKLGAMALFGEKYGKVVRVIRMGTFSTEFCGGTHVDNTAQIGLFKITSETSVAAGVRRIEGVTGLGVLALIAGQEEVIRNTAHELKAPAPADMPAKAAALHADLNAAHKEIDRLNSRLAASQVDGLLAGGIRVGKSGKVLLVTAALDGVPVDVARSMTDMIKEKNPAAVAVLAVSGDGKLNFLAAAGKEAVALGAHAGKLVGAVAAVTGGKGGGRPDNAMAGGRDIDQIPEALSTAEVVLGGMLKD